MIRTVPAWVPQWHALFPLLHARTIPTHPALIPGSRASFVRTSHENPVTLPTDALHSTLLTGHAVFQGFHAGPHDAVCGYEALIRPVLAGTPLAPPQLFALAHSPHALQQTDQWALQHVAQAVRSLPFAPPLLSLNLRTVTLANPSWVHDYLTHLGLPASRLLIEILETDTLPPPFTTWMDLRTTYPQLAFAVDDWGGGLNDLSRIFILRPEWIKLDRVWVVLAATHSAIAPFLHTFIAWAHDEGIRVIAEGIETRLQREWIDALGIDAAQGYLWGVPTAWPAMDPRLTLSPSS